LKNKKYKLFLLISAAVVVIAVATVILLLSRNDDITEPDDIIDVVLNENIVLLVNGEAINRREFQFRMERRRGPVIHHFRETYGADSNAPLFWTTYFGEITPMDFSREQTLNNSIFIKMEQILANERGIIDDITYEYFLEILEEENAHRRQAREQGQVVHGVSEVSEESFFNSRHQYMVEYLLESLIHEGLITPSRAEIEQYFNDNIDNFRHPDDLTVQIIYVPYIFGYENSRNEAQLLLEEILAQLQNNLDFDALANHIINGNVDGVSYQELVIDDETDPMTFDNFWYAIVEAAEMPIGTVSGIIDNFDNLAIIRCTERVYRGFMTLSEVEPWISNRLAHRNYFEFINSQIAAANIIINYEVFNSMTIPEELW